MSATLLEGDEFGDWTVKHAGGDVITVQHPLPMGEDEAMDMLQATGILALNVADLAHDVPVLVTAAGNDDVLVWDPRTGEELERIDNPGDHLFVKALYVDQRGTAALMVYQVAADRYCYETGVEGYVRVNLSRTSPPKSILDLPIGWIVQDAGGDLSELLITKGSELRIMDASTGNIRHTVSADSPIIRAIFDRNNRFFAAATRAGRIFVWDLASGLPIADRLIFDPDPYKHNGAPCDDDYYSRQGSLKFSPDSRFLGLRAQHMTNDTDEPTIKPLRWQVSHYITEPKALARITEAIAGAKLDDVGSLERLLQPDLDAIKMLYQEEISLSQHHLPIWIVDRL